MPGLLCLRAVLPAQYPIFLQHRATDDRSITDGTGTVPGGDYREGGAIQPDY